MYTSLKNIMYMFIGEISFDIQASCDFSHQCVNITIVLLTVTVIHMQVLRPNPGLPIYIHKYRKTVL